MLNWNYRGQETKLKLKNCSASQKSKYQCCWILIFHFKGNCGHYGNSTYAIEDRIWLHQQFNGCNGGSIRALLRWCTLWMNKNLQNFKNLWKFVDFISQNNTRLSLTDFLSEFLLFFGNFWIFKIIMFWTFIKPSSFKCNCC